MALRISLIIPMLNEARGLKRTLNHVARLNGVTEVLVVDGGSDDGSAELAERLLPELGRSAHGDSPGALRGRLIHAPKGRASQLNAGAAEASGDALFFIHADSLPPLDSAYWIGRYLTEPGVVAGAFKTWHVPEPRHQPQPSVAPRPQPARFALPWLHLADLRSRYTRLPYGDQGLFLTPSTFNRVGGYPVQPLMEDLELALRLSRLGRIRIAPARILVSGRRFQQSPLRDTLLVNTFPLLYRAGVSPGRLAALYRDLR